MEPIRHPKITIWPGIAIRHNVFNKAVPTELIGERPDPDAWTAAVKPQPGDTAWVMGHTHNFDHLTLCVRGSFAVFAQPVSEAWQRWQDFLMVAPQPWSHPTLLEIARRRDAALAVPWSKRVLAPVPRDYPGHFCDAGSPACFYVKADWVHWLVALEPLSEYGCLYPPRDEAGQVVEHFTSIEQVGKCCQ